MPPRARRDSSIPLLCTLCSNNPQFSDVSHLLTHISSKGHLHSRFQLQIRSQTEPAARRQLDNYDTWYRVYGLDTLLSARLAVKERKQAAKQKKNRASNAAGPAKKENKQSNEGTLDITPIYRASVPPMHLWPTTACRPNSTPIGDDWVADSIYETPSATRRLPHFSQQSPSRSMLDPELRTPVMNRNNEDDNDEEKIGDSATKLKGVLWPGMNLFDSATPEMKRMRNQRKDGNVLEQMMATSADIEPSEVSYFADGQFRASRDIFGPPSCETSPVKEEEQSPKKRRPRKPTFSDLSVNAPHPRPSRGKVAGPKCPKKGARPSTMHDQAPYGPPQLNMAREINPLSTRAIARSVALTLEDDEELRMTVGSSAKKRPFGVFREGTEDSPESLFGEHRFSLPNHGLQTYPTNMESSRHISPTPVVKSSLDIYGKENSKPEFHPGLRPQRPTPSSSSLVLPSQVLHDATSNPLYNEALARSFGCGDYNSGFAKSTRRSRYSSTFNGDFRPLPRVADTNESQDEATSPKNGPVPRRSTRYGI